MHWQAPAALAAHSRIHHKRSGSSTTLTLRRLTWAVRRAPTESAAAVLVMADVVVSWEAASAGIGWRFCEEARRLTKRPEVTVRSHGVT